MRFQKLTRNVFLTLHGHNVHRQQQELSKFLMRYQQFASRAYCGAAGLVSKMASEQEKAFCVLRFEVSRSVITVQREFRARFRKDAPAESLFLLRRHLGNWPRGPAVSMRSELVVADGVRCARVRWEINFLLTFETVHSFVYTLYIVIQSYPQSFPGLSLNKLNKNWSVPLTFLINLLRLYSNNRTWGTNGWLYFFFLH